MSDTDQGGNRTELREGAADPQEGCPEWCPPDRRAPSDYNDRYDLFGRQVEFQAAWWLDPKSNGPIRVPTLEEVKRAVEQRLQQPEDSAKQCPDTSPSRLTDPLFPFFQSQEELERDFDVLFNDFVRCRDEPLDPSRLSLFLNLQKQPFGALFNTTYDQFRVDRVLEQESRLGRQGYEYVRTGTELARLFERETPGLYHHHALHWFLYERPDISPPRHARIWMALNLTIYAALSAAWYFKWAYNADSDNANDDRVSFAIRPYEYARDARFVLYDLRLNPSGAGSDGPEGPPNCPSPGTPRHPAYPSGHSTYSAAASRILDYFVGHHEIGNSTAKAELCKLADNIGEARLYAGVHWIRDHRFGQLVGTTVADLVIAQLREDCIPALPQDMLPDPTVPPSDDTVRDAANRPCPPQPHDRIPDRSVLMGPDGRSRAPASF